LFLLDDVL
jgi:hypothetical protein